MKHFLLFLLYTMMASAMLAGLCLHAFYSLVTSENTRFHTNQPDYFNAFICGIVALVEGAMFAYFTWDLLCEQVTSIEENQGYVDEIKKQFGV